MIGSIAQLLWSILQMVAGFFGVRVAERKDFVDSVDKLPAPQDANDADKKTDDALDAKYK